MGKAKSGFTPGVATGSTPSQGTGSHSPAADPAKRVITQDTHPGAQALIPMAPTNSKDGVILTPHPTDSLVQEPRRARGGVLMAGNYRPTADEIDAFNRELTRVSRMFDADGEVFTASDLRLLAGAQWPGENVRVKSDALDIAWLDSNPDLVADEPAQPAAGTPSAQVQGAPRPLPPQPQKHPNAAVQAARDAFVDTYGAGEGVKIITAHDGYDHSGVVFDAHGVRKGRGDGLDEQARAEIAALPAYGQPGWGEAKRKLTQIRQAAARRAAAAQQATPAQSRRAAERAAVAGFEGVETGTWDQVRAAAGNQLLYERNRAMAKRYGQQ